MNLTDSEILILAMLADISKRTKGDPEIDPSFVTRTLLSNQHWGLLWKFDWLPFGRGENPPLVSETVDILEMFSLTIDHFNDLSETEQDDVKSKLGYAARGLESFPGFDGNHDPHFGIARYLVEDLERFKSLPGATNNSHTQSSLPRYRAMYRVYEPLRDGLGSGRLKPDDIIAVFSAT